MSEIDPLERILADLAERGYDAAKIGIARNVLGRLAKFAGERGFAGLVDADLTLFLEKVAASGASEKAVGVFRIVLQDSAPFLVALRSAGSAPEAEIEAPPAPAPPEEPVAEAVPEPVVETVPQPELAAESAPEPEPALRPAAPEPPAPPDLSRETVFAPSTPSVPLPELPAVPLAAQPEIEAPLPAPSLPAGLLPTEAAPSLESFPARLQELEPSARLQVEPLSPLPSAEPSLFDRLPEAPPAPDLPSGIDWGNPESPEPLAVEEPEPLAPIPPSGPLPPLELAALEAGPLPTVPPSEPLPLSSRATLAEEYQSYAPQLDGIPSIPWERPPLPPAPEPPPLPEAFAPSPEAELPPPDAEPAPSEAPLSPAEIEAPVESPLPPIVEEGAPPEEEELPSSPAPEEPAEFGVEWAPAAPALSEEPPQPLHDDWVDQETEPEPAEPSDADALLAAAAPFAEPMGAPPAVEEPPASTDDGLFAPRPTMVAALEEPAAAASSEEPPVDVPAELVRQLTPRPTAEIPHQPANVHFEKSASDLLGTPPEPGDVTAGSPLEEEPREIRRALVRDNLNAVLPTLLGQLESSDRERKQEARSLLREAGEAVAPALTDALLTASPALAAELFGLLAEGNRPEVARGVVDHLKSESADPLSLVAAGGEPAIRLLLSRLSMADELDREVICGCIEGNPEIAVGPLLEAVDGRDEETRGYALRVLGLLGRVEAVPGLAKGLESPDDDTRASSAMALVTIGRPSVDAIGEVLLKSDDPDVQYEAAKALGLIGHSSAIAYLVQAISERKIAHTAADSLVRIGKASTEGFVELLGHPETEVRALAVDALGRLNDPGTIPPLRARLADEDQGVRDATRSVLEKLGVPFEELLEAAESESIHPPAETHEEELARIRTLAESGDLPGARSAAATLFDRHPDDVAAGRVLADLEILLGENVEALATLDRLLRRRAALGHEETMALLLLKAKTCDRLGQRWEAVGALDQLLFTDDSNEEARALHDEWSRDL
jgi:HEAT repeat protein